MRRLYLLPLIAVVSTSAGPAVRYPAPIEKGIAGAREGCVESGGRFSLGPQAIKSADLDGDGTPDFLFDGNQAQCSGAVRNDCGSAGCGISIFLSSRNHQEVQGFIGYKAWFETSQRPARLRFSGKGGDGIVRWGGSAWIWEMRGGVPTGAQAASRPSVAAGSASQAELPGSVWETIPGPPISALSPMAGALDSLMLSCTGTGRGVRVSAKLPREPVSPTLGLSFIAGPGRAVSFTLNHVRGQWWGADLDAPRFVELLSGTDRALTYTINGRPGGLLSLKGSTAILRTVLAACPNSRAPAPVASVPAPAAVGAGWAWRYVDRDGDLKAAWGGPESGWDYTLNCDVRGRAIVFESYGATPSSGRRATISVGSSAPAAGLVTFETEGMESGKVALPAASQVWTDLAAGKSPLKVRWSGGPVDELPNAPALRRVVSECRARSAR